MKNGMVKGLITGALIGGSAAAVYGIMNWQTAKRMNRQVRTTGQWLSSKAESLTGKLGS